MGADHGFDKVAVANVFGARSLGLDVPGVDALVPGPGVDSLAVF